ncbi:divalent metal cation transporter [Arenibacter sp. TNZ]|jgi:NRAMP (natural resistance-associated macrophage protein)-like metal ion transporter|uniref:Nramp family divalent metal transporter n=1 Tax=Arenibacter TaxID=178469 RepID=UPI000CD423D5|nr:MULTISPECIES: Nramp family divalent metal transporter [Arenibacter]MCM4172786.1 divalent metal cation transporter [Arenibacter sp. TNZ]
MDFKIKNFFKSLGPGFIIAAVVLGPGSITVSSKIGATHGYSFLWVILVGAISMSVYTTMSVRFGVLHEKSLLKVISEKYGKWLSIAIGVCSFLAALSFQFGNNLGVGMGMKTLTGINETIWPFIFTPLAIVLVFYSKNLYKALEQLMMIMVVILILAFIVNLIFIRPDLEAAAMGFIPSAVSSDNFNEIAALVGTTFVLHNAFYQSYLVQGKGWKLADLPRSIRDTKIGVSLLALISILVIITAAATLKPRGISVNSAADMAIQLEMLLGSFAKYIFGFGFMAAAFSSLLVNSVTGGGLLADSMGMGSSMNEKMPKVFTAIILIAGMVIAVFFRGNVIYALIMAQASSILGVPLIAIGLFLVLNSKSIMGKYRNNNLQNFMAVVGFILISVLVYFMYGKLIGYLAV